MFKKGHWTIFVNMLVYYVAEFLCFLRVFCVLGQIWPPLVAKRELCQSWGIMGYIRKAIYKSIMKKNNFSLVGTNSYKKVPKQVY